MSTSVSSVTSHFPDAENGFSTTTSGAVSSGAATVGLNSTAGYTNGMPVVFVIDPGNAKKQTFTGTIDTGGNQVTNVVWTAGTNVAHDAGATVVDYATATHISMISKGILVEHNQDGTHDEALITSRTEDTSPASGDYLLTSDVSAGNALKKVSITNLFANIPAGSVETADIANGAVTLAKMTTSAQAATVATQQTTTSTSHTDLATSGPAATVTIGSSGMALVGIGFQGSNNTPEAIAIMGFAVSGASTSAAGDEILFTSATADDQYGASRVRLVTGLTAGSTTFTAKYRVTGGTGTFLNRNIWVLPL